MKGYTGLAQQGFPDPLTAGQGRAAQQVPQGQNDGFNQTQKDFGDWAVRNGYLKANPYQDTGGIAGTSPLINTIKAIDW